MNARMDAEDGEPPEAARVASSSSWLARARELIDALREVDEGVATEAVSNWTRSRRLLAPLAVGVGGVEIFLTGVKVLLSNWRLMLVQVLPVLVIWWAMYDLRAHVLARNSDPGMRGPVLVPVALAIIAITAAAFFMNSVFAFAVSQPERPEVRPAVTQARGHLGVILGSGAVVGLMLALAMTVISRSHRPWFELALGVAIGILMVCYVAVPARLIGVKPKASTRDKLSASIVAGAVGLAVAAPPYVLGRVGVLMLGIHPLFIPGLAVVTVAVALEAGATVAVKAVKMTSKLVAPKGQRGTVEM